MPPVARTEIEVYLEAIATEEGVQVGDDAIQLIAETADGDVRQAVTMLQAVAMGEKGVDMSDIRNLFSIAPPSKIESLVDAARRGDIRSARNRLESLIVDHGMAGEDIVDELHEQVLNRQLSEEMTIRLAERIGQTDYRLGQGADERLQVESLLASIVRLSRGSQATSSDSTTT
jgi:replication factor C small subunit